MEIKFNKKNVFTTEISTVEKKNKAHKISVTFELDADDINGAVVDYSALDRLKQLEKNTIDDLSMIRRSVGARYGSVVSINERTHWTLSLMSRNATGGNNRKTSISSILDGLLSHVTKSSFISDAELISIKEDQEEDLNKDMQSLYKVFYCKDDNPDIKKLDEQSSSTDLKELFIPDLTYHVVPLFRFLLLGLINPKLLSNSELTLIRDLIPNSELPEKGLSRLNKPFITDDNNADFREKLRNNEIDFIKVFKDSESELKEIEKEIAKERNQVRPDESLTTKKNSQTIGRKSRIYGLDPTLWLSKKYSLQTEKMKAANVRNHFKEAEGRAKAGSVIMIGSLKEEDIILYAERFKLIAEISKKAGDLKLAN